jgi:hypothetical protein
MRKSRWTQAISALALVAAITVGVSALTSEVNARPPGPGGPPLLCGPTILFECTFRDGTTELVGLTRCEVERYEKKNKATCVPASF